MSAEPTRIDTTIAPMAAPMPRRQYGPWTRALWSIPLYGLFVPLARILELTGAWPRMMSRGMARMMRDSAAYTPNAHDVMIGSYFKSGTNWTMQIAAQIAHRGAAEFDHIHDIVPWLEMPARNSYAVPVSDEATWRASPTGLRAIKTHLPFSALAYAPEARYVWVVRDPKDVLVSGYHFLRSVMLGPMMPSVHRWLDLFLSEDTFTGSWAVHLDSGWRRRHEPNVLFLTYEEMKADRESAVRRIAALMGVDLTPGELAAVVARSSYTYMKSIGDKFDTRGLSPPWAKARGAMVRRGETGSASELLSATDQRRIDEYWRAELAKLGSDFPYDEHYGAAARSPA
jgi:Sulfotransferase domain